MWPILGKAPDRILEERPGAKTLLPDLKPK